MDPFDLPKVGEVVPGIHLPHQIEALRPAFVVEPGPFQVSRGERTPDLEIKKDTVFRTKLMLRFRPATPDSLIERSLTDLDAVVGFRGPAGSLVVRLPDPGPAPGAVGRLVDRLKRLPGIESVLPFRYRPFPGEARPGDRSFDLAILLAGTDVGRLRGKLRDKARRPAPGYLCLARPPHAGLLKSPLCRRPGPSGYASFDSLVPYDVRVYAICVSENPEAVIVADSAVRRLRSKATTTIELDMRRCASASPPAPPRS